MSDEDKRWHLVQHWRTRQFVGFCAMMLASGQVGHQDNWFPLIVTGLVTFAALIGESRAS